ncbi:MAG: PKD domain-containing protein, partial [Thermoplasmatales archaeon]|nr:PKD domain-containing protein [Thermoplasmatales archaeon]
FLKKTSKTGYTIQFSDNANITNNHIYNNPDDGVDLYSSSNNNISANHIYNNGDDGIYLYDSSNINITANHIYNSSGYGIYLDESFNINITSNQIRNNSYGIWFFMSLNNIIYNNYFENTNNWGGGDGAMWNISKTPGTNIIGGPYLGGNYWSDYTGCDIDGDGLGDTNLPYGPGDYLPLTAPNFEPTADFTYSPEQPTDLETVQFTSTSTDPDSDVLTFFWNFDDGEISNYSNPTHQYADNGIYTVTLTVTDIHGASNATSKQITVLNVGPTANFTYSPENPTDLEYVYFTDTSTDADGSIYQWYWEFGDGGTSNGQNPTHQYGEAGNYTVSLTVTDDDGATNATSKQITVIWETTIRAEFSEYGLGKEITTTWPWENITVSFNVSLYVRCYYSTATEINVTSSWHTPTCVYNITVFPTDIVLPEMPGGSNSLVFINVTLNQSVLDQLEQECCHVSFGIIAKTRIVEKPQCFVYSYISENSSVFVRRTFSNSTDYDYDGIPDAAEVWLGLNPANSSDALLDPDSDGWDNLHEYLNGTNMHNWDTDGDGLSDAFEIIFSKTNPTVGDTNGNGLSDGLEFIQNQGYSGSMQILPNGWIGMTIACANYTMYAETNSSVLEGRYNKDKKTLRIKIHGPPETTGVANITIPKDMVDSEKDIKIQLDGHLINYTLSQNTTHYFIHIEYTHSTHELAARFTSVTAVALNNPVNPTKDSLTLSWDACLSPEFDRYEVYQSTVSGVLGSLIETVTDPDAVSCTVTDLSPDTTYYFTVRVVYNDGFYADSDQMFEKTSAAIQQIPVIVSGKNVNVTYNGTGNLSVGNASATKIEFLKEKIPSGKKDIGVFVNVTKIGEVGYANITIRYNDNDIVGIEPATLIMYYWNETSSKWESCAKIGTTGVDTINKIVWANVTHFTIFAPMAEKTAAGKEAAPISLLSYIIIFAVAIILISAGLGVKKMKKEKTATVRCPKCGENIKVTSTERPVEIVCPKCGAKGTLK